MSQSTNTLGMSRTYDMDENNERLVSGTFFQILETKLPILPDGVYNCQPITGESDDGACVIARYNGGIGLPCFNAFKKSLTALFTPQTKTFVVDLGNVHTLSRSAMGALLDFNAAVFGLGKKLYVYRPSELIEKKFHDLKVHGFFHFLHSEDDLLNIFPI